MDKQRRNGQQSCNDPHCAASEGEGEEVKEDEVVLEEEDVSSYAPIDRGWAWVIVLGSFGVMAIAVGIVKSFGVLLVELSRRYDAPASLLAFSQSLCSCLHIGLGTLSNALSVKFGHRRVVFCGGILAAIGLVSSAFVSSIEAFFVTYGLITGFGLGLSLSPALVVFGLFFKRHLALANGLAASGSGLGAFVLPYLMLYLLEEYGLEGCMLILGGMALHICIFASLFRPLSFWHKTKSAKLAAHDLKSRVKCATHDGAEKEGTAFIEGKTGHKLSLHLNNMMEISSSLPCIRKELIVRGRCRTHSQHLSDPQVSTDSSQNTHSVSSPMLFSSIESISAMSGKMNDSENTNKKTLSSKEHNKKLVNWALLKDPVFQMINWGLFCGIYSHHTVFTVIPSIASENGFRDSQGTIAVSIIGICDLIGRISAGVISNMISWKRVSVYRLALAMFGVVSLIVTFASDFIFFAILCGFLGLFTGGYAGIQITVLSEGLGKDNLSSSWGYVSFFASISLLASPFVAGILKDSTHSWITSLRLSSAVCFLGVSIISLKAILHLKDKIRKFG